MPEMDAEICGRFSFTITRNEPSFNLSCYSGANVPLTRLNTADLGSIACIEFNHIYMYLVPSFLAVSQSSHVM